MQYFSVRIVLSGSVLAGVNAGPVREYDTSVKTPAVDQRLPLSFLSPGLC